MTASTAATDRSLRWRSARTLLSMCVRPDPKRAALGFAPFFPLSTGLSYVAARQLLRALPRHNLHSVVVAAVVFTCAFVLSVLLGRKGNTVRVRLVELTKLELDQRILDATVAIPDLEKIEHPEYLDRMELLRTRAQAVAQAPRMIGWLVDNGGGMVMSIILLITIRPELVLLLLAGVPAMIINDRAETRAEEAQKAQAPASRRALHFFDLATTPGPAKEVRVTGLGPELLRRYEAEWRSADAILRRVEIRATLERALATLIAVGAFGWGLLVLVHLARTHRIGPGDIFIALGLMGMVVGQVGGAASGVLSFRRSLAVVDNLVWLQQAADEARRDGQARRSRPPARLVGGIELRDVSFTYRGATRPALQAANLVLPAGTVVALVGDNGAGKSTLVKLLYGLYRPSEGAVLIDGVNLDQIPLEAWRERTSACFQDFLQLQLTAQESIGAGDLPNVDSAERATSALERAAALDLLDRLEDGLSTVVGAAHGGTELSGGQWQKLAIARAMMRTQPLLLALDEPTSALDPLAEYELFDRYAAAARTLGAELGTVTVLVSHRFSTVHMADLIFVLDEGQVVEQGSHSELMARGGLYARLFETQASQYRP